MNQISRITEAQKDEFRAAFRLFDKDGDGTISTSEIGNIMRQLGINPSQAELNEMINEVDVDGNGEVDFDEFCIMMTKRLRENDTQEEIQQAFKQFDVDKDGFISRNDLQTALATLGGKTLGDHELDELFLKCDLDKDGKFDYEEFSLIITPK